MTESHFDYSNANRARFMQSNAAKVLLLFRQYSLNMTWFLWRNLYQSIKGQAPEVRREARTKLGGVLGMTGLFAGLMGMPLTSVMFGLADAAASAFGDDDDEPFDSEVAFRNFLADLLGADAARILAKGPVDYFTSASIGSRVSLNDLWFREPNRELEGKEMADYLLEQAGGPLFGGMLVNTLRGLAQVQEGHTWRGVETMMPKAVKDGMKSVRYTTQGVNTLRGDPVIEDLGVGGFAVAARGILACEPQRAV
ncbi:PLxRFG domain-containing protein [Stenotrophomonas sp. NRRL B-14846]|uniref:PLxRFG domain-containing protein n=1 Tax=Stenotrophomonas sp. NRRL B-14846 TaxID=3162882 RepID=UPI003D2E6C9A